MEYSKADPAEVEVQLVQEFEEFEAKDLNGVVLLVKELRNCTLCPEE